MSKNRNPKNPKHKYFDLHMIEDLDASSESYQTFLAEYSEFVLFRLKHFSAK